MSPNDLLHQENVHYINALDGHVSVVSAGLTHDVAQALEVQLSSAFQKGDKTAIAQVYVLGADIALAEGDSDRECFLLTHAWVYALEAGDVLADDCWKRLRGYGRV